MLSYAQAISLPKRVRGAPVPSFHDRTEFIWGNKTEEPTMCGLCTWPIVRHRELSNPHVCVNKGGQPLSTADLDNLLRQLWLDEHADYNQGDWRIVCH